jgi:glycerol-3-phosphate acyltransferase PlsY
MATLFLFTAIAFLIGAIPTGFLVGLLHGVDIRKHGSGNIGATNAKRVLGKKAGLYTLIGDALKGAVPILVLPLIDPSYESIRPVLGLAAILGHCFSPFLSFNGGKGVATSLGAFACLAPIALAAAIVVFVLNLSITKYVSLSSLLASVTLAITVSLHTGNTNSSLLLIVASLACILIFARHKENIERLVAGTESKFGSAKK